MLRSVFGAIALIIFHFGASAFADTYIDSAGFVRLSSDSRFGCDSKLVGGQLLKILSENQSVQISAKKTIRKFKKKRSRVRHNLVELKQLLAHETTPPPSLKKKKLKLKKKLAKFNQLIQFIKDCTSGAYYNSESEPFISLFYDRDGVPYIKSDSDKGAFYGLGYAHAALRLLEMTLHRLRGEGRLAEFFGRIYPLGGPPENRVNLLEMDLEMRRLGLRSRMQQIYTALPDETKEFLDAFADGVNAYVSDQAGALPFTFEEFSIPFQAWSGIDVLVTYASYALLFTGGYGSEIESLEKFNADVQRIGYEEALVSWLNSAQIRDWESAIIQSNTQSLMSPLDGGVNLASNLPAQRKASHNFVVAGEFNLTGFPIMVGLPMVDLGWRFLVEANIEGATFRAHGAGFPGTIGFLVGYSDHTSWAVTALGADVADLFALVPAAGSNPQSYILDGIETPYLTRVEEIKVKGEDSQTPTILESYFGPVIAEENGIPYAVRHIALTELSEGRVHPVQGLIAMMRSDDLDQFHQAATGFYYPSVHLIYASNEGAHGRIGYMPNAALPLRSDAAPLKGVLPQDGSKRSNDWTGIIARDQIPHLHDPASGFIVTGNNLPTDQDIYGYSAIGHSDRSLELNKRISDLIAEHGVLSTDQVVNQRFGCTSVRVEYMRDLMNYLIENFPSEIELSNPNIASAIQYFNLWGGTLSANEPYYPLVAKIRGRSITFFRSTSMAHEVYGGGEGGLIHFLRKFKENPSNVITPEYRAEIINWLFDRSLALAWVETIASPDAEPPGYGPDPAHWSDYMDRNLVIRFHSDGIFESSLMREHNIVISNLECQDAGTIRSQSGNFYTQVTYLNNMDQAETLYAPGNDENPFSEAFENQMQRFQSSETKLSPLSIEQAQSLCSGSTSGSRSCRALELTPPE